MLPDTERWQLLSGFRLRWQSWGDEYVVYHSGSGDTHLLDPIAAEVLKNLECASANTSELLDRISISLDIKADGDLAAMLEQLLSEFYKLGLIERSRL